MKSARRHELQTNVLANQAGQVIEKSKPFAGGLLIGIAVVMALLFIFLYMSSRSSQKNMTAWSEYYFASGSRDAGNFQAVYEDFASTQAAGWARQSEADSQLSNGLQTFYIDRQQADELFKQARSAYETILDENDDALLRSRATIGLAQTMEAQGQVENAVAEYKKLLTMEGITEAMAKEFQRRIEWLQSKESQDFYAWYQAFQPSPAPPIELPKDLGSVPSVPDMSFPKLPDLTTPSSSSTPPAEPTSNPSIVAPPIPTSDTPANEDAGSGTSDSSVLEPKASGGDAGSNE